MVQANDILDATGSEQAMRIDPESIARQTIAEPATAAAVAALIDLMSALHRRRTLHQQGAPARALLAHLAKFGPMRPADLAASMNLDQSTISRHLTQLSAQGLIERDAHPRDGRASVLRVTEAGWHQAQALIAGRIAEVAEIIDGWPENDRATFARLLSQFTAAFEHGGDPATTSRHGGRS